MKYFKITDISLDLDQKSKGLVADIPSANGEYVVNGREYFDRIGNGEIIEDTPIFDYFHLQSFGEEKDWEWRLQDVHGFIGAGSIMDGWYISDDFKLLLENFKIAPKYHFYETRLLYKGDKLKYWIFQFGIDPLKNINFRSSKFYYLDNNSSIVEVNIESDDIFIKKRRTLLLDDDIELECSKVSYKESYDLIYNLPSGDNLCSESLKKAIETMGLKGFDFSELDYEVIVGK